MSETCAHETCQRPASDGDLYCWRHREAEQRGPRRRKQNGATFLTDSSWRRQSRPTMLPGYWPPPRPPVVPRRPPRPD